MESDRNDLRHYGSDSPYGVSNIRFLLDKHKYVLCVEGLEDQKFYRTLFDNYNMYILIAGDKKRAFRMLDIVKPQDQNRCKALIDRDYDLILYRKTIKNNVVYTDANSLETQIWMMDQNKNILRKILNEIVESDTINDIKSLIDDIYESAVKTSYYIGLIRLISEKEEWNIKFDDYILKDDEFIKGELNMNKYICRLLDRDPDSKDVMMINDSVYEIIDSYYDSKWEIIQGHDLSMSFIYFIDYKCRIYKNYRMSLKDFEQKVRLACNVDTLHEAEFYKIICKWAVIK